MCGYDQTLVCDGYSSYAALEHLADRKGDLGLNGVPIPNFTLAGCWSHGHRGFFHAQAQSSEAKVILDDIDELLAIDREAVELAERSGRDLVAVRHEFRQARSREVVTRIYDRCDEALRLSGTAFDKAIVYLTNQKRPLTRFLEDGRVPLTNNHAERPVRSPVQGRKAHQGSRSEGGTRIASAYYTVIGSCGLVGVDPVEFMKILVARGRRPPGYALLPRDYAAELASEGQPPQG